MVFALLSLDKISTKWAYPEASEAKASGPALQGPFLVPDSNCVCVIVCSFSLRGPV